MGSDICRPRSMAIDSGTIVRSGDGSTAPSEGLDGGSIGQVGEQAARDVVTTRKSEGCLSYLPDRPALLHPFPDWLRSTWALDSP